MCSRMQILHVGLLLSVAFSAAFMRTGYYNEWNSLGALQKGLKLAICHAGSSLTVRKRLCAKAHRQGQQG